MSFIGSARPGFIQRGQQFLGSAAQTFAQQDRVVRQNAPGKTAGGALMGGLTGAGTGAMIGSAVPAIGTAIGAVGGAIIGIGGYLFS